MPDSWRKVPIGQIATVYDGPHATPRKTAEGPWYLSISSLRDGTINLAESVHLSEDDYPRWTKRVAPRPGDTLFSYETRLGAAGHWDRDEPAALGRRMGLLRPKRDQVDPRFLTYAYLGPHFQETIRQRKVHGATVERILVADLHNWHILVPSLDVQREIAGALGALDDLIETNQGLAAKCEDLAVLLVEQLPGSTTLGNAMTLVTAATTPQGKVDHFSLPAFDAGCVPVREQGSNIRSNKIPFTAPSLLISRLNPHIPRSWMAYPGTEATAMASTEFAAFQGPEVEFYWAACAGPQFRELMCSMVTGTTGSHQRVDKQALSRIPVPDAASADPRLLTAVTLLVRQAYASRLEAADLKRTRDELLPLLLSGRVLSGEVA